MKFYHVYGSDEFDFILFCKCITNGCFLDECSFVPRFFDNF